MTDIDRRNPYIILGLPFGSNEEEARAGFAKARRRLRRDPDAQYTTEDLTWALHQIEQLITHPELAIDVYRVPADPGAIESDARGVFHPAPHPVARTTDTESAEEWEQLRAAALSNAVRRVLTERLEASAQYIPYQ
ncbi:MAG: hypothetical protein E2O95_04105 [Acidobacteria bacterium]|nr:MAG: hypothetical protein E2O95_04105 [Acidobacteriota bacterium]